jgi:DNA-binding GntR family transcriptional regulator
MAALSKLESYRTKNELVYDFLKTNILNHEFAPGERIVISDIAKKLKVSDIPVREAIKRLETEGLIDVIPHVGARVVEVNREDIKEIYLIRSELESLATRVASKCMKERDFDKLEKVIKESEELLESRRYEKFGELNKKFHMQIYDCTPYKLLLRIISDLWASSHMLRSVFLMAPDRCAESLEEHKLILQALREGRGKAAGQLVRRQKMAAWNAILRFMEEEKRKSRENPNEKPED